MERNVYKYSHDIDFQKLKKFGVCKFELKVKINCKNSDKCKWSYRNHYAKKNSAASDVSPYKICLKVQMKANKKYTSWKPFFITYEIHDSLLQKSTNESNKIDNKEPDYRYCKTSEFTPSRTTNQ